MTISLSPREFIHNFIDPLNEIDKVGRISVYHRDGELYSVVSTSSGGIHLYNSHTPALITDPVDRFSINIQKLQRGLNCVPRDDSFITLNVDRSKGVCSFATTAVKFNIRLLDDNMISVSKFNVDTFQQFPFHHEIPILASKFASIKKVMDFCPENKKFYLEQDGKSVIFYFGDKGSTSKHTDDIQILVADDVATQIPNRIYDIDVLRLIFRQKNDILMKLHDNGVMSLEATLSNTSQRYITVPLIK